MSAVYCNSISIKETLDYGIGQEKEFSYSELSQNDVVKHIASFISGLWQIHPFFEGNTRTIAVFTIKYLRRLGFNAYNDTFEKNYGISGTHW